jgi:hypothetical protein
MEKKLENILNKGDFTIFKHSGIYYAQIITANEEYAAEKENLEKAIDELHYRVYGE